MSEPEIVEVPVKLVIGRTRRGRYGIIAEMIAELCAAAAAQGIKTVGAPVFVCHETSMLGVMVKNLLGLAQVEVAVPVAAKGKESGPITFYELPGGKMVKVTHQGPYNKVSSAYGRLFAWLGKRGLKPTGFSREVYVNDPKTARPEDLMTEIYVPVKP